LHFSKKISGFSLENFSLESSKSLFLAPGFFQSRHTSSVVSSKTHPSGKMKNSDPWKTPAVKNCFFSPHDHDILGDSLRRLYSLQ